jgi:hypothetical protein
MGDTYIYLYRLDAASTRVFVADRLEDVPEDAKTVTS